MEISVPVTFREVLQSPDLDVQLLGDDGTFPNNETLPLLVYRGAFQFGRRSPSRTVEEVFRAHDWGGIWRDGIFSYHHFHSTAHEVLAVSRGAATVQLGGPDGITRKLETGDVLILPAGVAHKHVRSDVDFQVIGAYPEGQTWDLKTGHADERPEVDRNIEEVPLPSADPVYGVDGPLQTYWTSGA